MCDDRYIFQCLTPTSTGMTTKQLEMKIKAAKIRAVDNFASKHNGELHDKARSLNPPPHPNKLVGEVD